jgi:hypothetical protein
MNTRDLIDRYVSRAFQFVSVFSNNMMAPSGTTSLLNIKT